MSLTLSKAFIAALRTNDELMRQLGAKLKDGTLQGARLFTVARPTVDEEKDKIPYIIIMPQGINSDGSEDDYEETDTCVINLLVVASEFATGSTPGLVDLAEEVRTTIREHLSDYEGVEINDYTFAASEVQYDDKKPCYWQILTYTVNTQNS